MQMVGTSRTVLPAGGAVTVRYIVWRGYLLDSARGLGAARELRRSPGGIARDSSHRLPTMVAAGDLFLVEKSSVDYWRRSLPHRHTWENRSSQPIYRCRACSLCQITLHLLQSLVGELQLPRPPLFSFAQTGCLDRSSHLSSEDR
jgi:hypothetical protein